MSLADLREAYRAYLLSTDLSKSTIQVSTSDAFYIWRKANASKFWEIVESPNFEDEAFSALRQLLPSQPDGSPSKNIQGYLAHLRRFRKFAFGNASSITSLQAATPHRKHKRTVKVLLPRPCQSEVERYLDLWNTLENYSLQEAALDKLFFTMAPDNTRIEDILLKVSTLNDFYSTNIFSVFPVAKHILSLNIDTRLKQGDPTLVDAIKTVDGRNHYSFATKYCSHHNPLEYPIYDSYVDKVLRYFRDTDGFCAFESDDLKQYDRFIQIVRAFRTYYNLEKYTLKEIDQYLWQLGKDYFPKAIRIRISEESLVLLNGVTAVPVTYSDEKFNCDKIDENVFLTSLAYKRTAFSHEKEVRLIKRYKYRDMEDAELHIKALLVVAEHPQWVEILESMFPDMEPEEKVKAISRLINTGVESKITQDVSYEHIPSFIEGVMVHPLAPDWYVDVVREYCMRNNIPFDGKSELYAVLD